MATTALDHHTTGILILTKINIHHCSSARCSSEADEAQLFSASATKTICTVIASSRKTPGDTKYKMAGKYHKRFFVSFFDPLHTWNHQQKSFPSQSGWIRVIRKVMILLEDSIWNSVHVRLFRRFSNIKMKEPAIISSSSKHLAHNSRSTKYHQRWK